MKSAAFTYKLLLKKEQKKDIADNEKMAFKHDLAVACEMLDQGYQLKDIMECLRKHSFFSTHTSNKKSLALYMDKVLSKINDEQQQRLSNAYPAAKELYLAKVSNIVNKYESYTPSGFNEYHEGSIVLDMLIRNKFNPEILKVVIEKNSIAPNCSSEYANEIVDTCNNIHNMYKDIKNAEPSKLFTEGDIYRYHAKEYMQKTQTDILNARDELHIISKIYQKLIAQYEQKNPINNHADKKKLEHVVNTQIKPFLISALSDASPVAVEPGRDKDFYIASVLGEFELANEANKVSDNHYAITEELYKEITDKLLGNRNNEKANIIYDGLIAKELLEDKQDENNIIKVIAENGLGVVENAYTYARKIVKFAKDALNAEREIFYFDMKKLPKTDNYQDLVNEGFTAKELYMQTLKERLDEYPSFLRKMSQQFADEDAVEKLLNKYQDFDRQALKAAIQENSPRAFLTGDANDYVDKLFLRVDDRLRYNRQQADQNAKIQQEFNKLRGLAAEGVNVDNALDKYKDGRVALKMLQKNISKEDIKRMLTAMAKTAGVVAPIVYANEIINQALIVNDRINTIRDYEPPLDGQKEIKDIYLEKIQEQYRKKDFIQTDMDVETVKSMILEHGSSDREIEYVLKEYSPVAAEPGRDEHYVDYIKSLADKAIEQEEERLNMYKVIPRLEHEADAKSEYDFHKKELMSNIDLPYRKNMEVLIIAAMMMQGFKESELKKVLAESSLNSEHDTSYSKNILKEAGKNLEAKEHQQEGVMVRTLTTTTTTTTTSFEN